MDAVSTLGLSLVVIYVLVKEVIGPLVRKKQPKPEHAEALSRGEIRDLVETHTHAQVTAQVAGQFATHIGRFSVFEVNLKTMETRITEFRDMVESNRRSQETATTALDNKLDIVLQEINDFKNEVASRLSAVETQLNAIEKNEEKARRNTRGR